MDAGMDARVDARPPPRDADMIPDAEAGPERCLVGVTEEPFAAAELLHHWRGAGAPFARYEQVISTPVVIDYLPDPSGERWPEIIFVAYERPDEGAVLRVIEGRPPYALRLTLAGDEGGAVSDETDRLPSLRYDAHPAAADLDGDGEIELVAVLEDGGLMAWRASGEVWWRAFFPDVEAGTSAALAIGDLEGDGVAEIVIGRTVLDGTTGRVKWVGGGGRGENRGGPISCLADVDGVAGLEVIAGRTVYRPDGTVLWDTGASSGDGYCAVADMYDAEGERGEDGLPEVIRVSNSIVSVHNGDTGEMIWGRSLAACGSNRGRGGPPTVADFDGDGLVEIGVAGAFCYSVYEPSCVGDPLPERCVAGGTLWRVATDDGSSSVTGSTVFDFNGDGRAEVVYNDEEYFRVFDGRTGRALFRDANPSRTRTEAPVVADVDNDGNAEIVFGANQVADFAGDTIPAAERLPGLQIWGAADDSWVGARPIWNQHTFHRNNVEGDGRIPRVEEPSWTTHNTYRLNHAFVDALAAPDLVPGGVTTETARCGERILRVCAEVQNAGETRFGAGLLVSFFAGDPSSGGTLIGRGRTEGTAEPGGMTQACVDWEDAPLEDTEVWVEVDVEDDERECREDNNRGAIGSVRCPRLQ